MINPDPQEITYAYPKMTALLFAQKTYSGIESCISTITKGYLSARNEAMCFSVHYFL